MDLTELLFAPILPFIGHPGRIAVVAILLLTLFWVIRIDRHRWSWSILWTTGFWLAFALWEWLMLRQEANIRVDLVLIYPVLLGISIWGLGAGLHR